MAATDKMQQAKNLKRAFAEHDIHWPGGPPKKTLFFDPTGPLIQYGSDGTLHVADLNPEISTEWQMSRWEMIRFGWRCIIAALWAA